MGRAGMALTQGLHDELRLGPLLDRLHAGDEAALLDQEFVLDRSLQGVGHGADSLTDEERVLRARNKPDASITAAQ